MQINFFNWIREGVRQSVLLGIGDAVDQLGTIEKDDIADRVRDALSHSTTFESGRIAQSSSTTRRKRLGRSLKDVDASSS